MCNSKLGLVKVSFLRKKKKKIFFNVQDYIPFIVTEMIYNLMILSP